MTLSIDTDIDLHIDFETASLLDLTKVGAYRYTEDESTFAHCLGWLRADTGDFGIWTPGARMEAPLVEGLTKGRVHAWNAQFERLVFRMLISRGMKLPEPTYSQWRCTAAQARASALPGKLENCAKVLRTDYQKADTRVMKKLADAAYVPTHADKDQLFGYCLTDVRVEYEISSCIPALSDDEQYIYELSERINDRGIMLDVFFCGAMTGYLHLAKEELDRRLDRLTKSTITKTSQNKRIAEYLGVDSLAKEHHEALLSRWPEESLKGKVLRCRIDAANSSVAKYEVMARQVCQDHRLRGAFIFAGAGQTGRYSGSGWQPHNLVRNVPKDAHERVDDIKTLSYGQHKLMDSAPFIHQAAKLVRSALIAPPGKTFVIGDYSAVEARGLPWLAGYQPEIDAWAAGVDRYVEDAANIGVDNRQVGKVVRLACGFGGRGGALMAMAKGYGIRLTESDAKAYADAWHNANPWVDQFGKDLVQTGLAAMNFLGEAFPSNSGQLTYAAEEQNGVIVLRCQLPSGRIISYHDAKVESGRFGPELSAVKPRTMTRERLWHGLMAENVTQAMCNDLLRYAILLLHTDGYAIVAHVHDETVEEVDEEGAEETADRIKDVMENRPEWAADFPLVANVSISNRYTK